MRPALYYFALMICLIVCYVLKKAHEGAAKTCKELADGIISGDGCGECSGPDASRARVLQHASAVFDSCAWAGRKP